jgi:predicted transcriptional regulator
MRATLERNVLQVLWEVVEPLTVREVLDRLNHGRRVPLAYTTVMTVLSRLTDKGWVVCDRGEKHHRYRAVAESDAALAVHRLLAEHGEAAVSPFLAQTANEPALRERLLSLMGHSCAASHTTRPGPPSWTVVYRGGHRPSVAQEVRPSGWTRWIG